MPQISIITTTYKHQDFIAETIESILAQTFTDWELLIWDDSPDDLTWNIIQTYVSRFPNKIKAWRHSPNKWIVDNMNFLIEKASNESEYIAFLEWDDLFTPDNLEEKLKVFLKYNDIYLVYSDINFINYNSDIFIHNFYKERKIPIIKNSSVTKKLYISIKQSLFVSWSNICIRKTILKDIKIRNLTNQKTYWGSDYDFWFLVSTSYNIYWIDYPLIKYRKHSYNISNNFFDMINLNLIILNFYYYNKIIDKEIYNKKLWWLYTLSSLNYFIEETSKSKALKELIKSFKYNIFSFITYKLAITFFLIMPNKINKYILNKLIKRW